MEYHKVVKLLELKKSRRNFFTTQSTAEILGISLGSARVFCSRYEKMGIFSRLKNNFYVLAEDLTDAAPEKLFLFSNLIQTPSYVSLGTALSYYEISTQMTRGLIEAISLVRTQDVQSAQVQFFYSKLDPKLYFGFERAGDFFIALPEKALLDALYLQSLGRYSLDISSLDLRKLSKMRLSKMLKKFPKKSRTRMFKLLNSIYERTF